MGEDELQEMFSKHGRVEKVNIMIDPHTRESRGFGFVKMNTSEEADAAKDALTGEERYGRVLTVEKARRARPSLCPMSFQSDSYRNTNSRKILWTS
jgi:transformer-2 protein